MARYYIDTSIWRDYFENRSDNFRPLGEWAFRLLSLIKSKEENIILSSIIMKEFEIKYSEEEIKNLLAPFQILILYVKPKEEQIREAKKIAFHKGIPKMDVLHAILARDNNAVLVTRDGHFNEISDIAFPKKPEELI